jgi:hypothetical protein
MAEKKDSHQLLAVHITDRLKKAPLVQKALTRYGDVIRTRLGLHEVGTGFSSSGGIMILDILGDSKARQLQKSLDKIKGIETKLIVFKH